MAEPQFQPEELDRIEDALEDLELDDDLIDDPSPAVRSRLADYRALLIASREALPMVDVPPGVLAGVLAEARRADDDLVELSAADATAQPQESWWSRMRKSFLIPTLAVVGTAALILVIVTPTYTTSSEDESASQVVARAEPMEQDGRAAFTPASPPPGAAPTVKAELAPDAPADPAEAPAEEEPLYEIATARRVAADTSKVAKESAADAPVAGGGKDQANADAIVEPKAAEKQSGAANWEAIERGDKARLGGDCFLAGNEYARALDDGNDSVRARAHVGLGLCAAEQGNSAKAEQHYEDARALDPEAVDYLNTQRRDEKAKPKKPAPQKKQNSRRKASMPSPSYESDSLPGDARNANPYKD